MNQLTQTNSLPAFMVEFQEIEKPKDFTDVIRCKSVKLQSFASKYGSDALRTILAGILADIAKLMRYTVTGEMIAVAAEIIIDEWPDTKLSDFHLFKKKVLSGAIGGKLFGNDTRTMCELWREYYASREEVFAEARESFYAEQKRQYAEEAKDAKAIKDVYAKMKADAEIQRKEQSYRNKVKTMTLEQLCHESNLPYQSVKDGIRELAETDFAEAGDIEMVFEVYLEILERKVLGEARKDRSVLNNLNSNNHGQGTGIQG